MKSFSIGGINIQVPIIQGGMGVGISLNGLASAVANQGGVGVISAAGLGLLYRKLSKDYIQASILGLQEEIRKAKEKTKGVIGVNIMVALSNFEDMVRTTIQEKADIIFAGAGLPLDLPKFLQKDSVTRLVPIVSSGKAARLIAERWRTKFEYCPDAFVVEGPKAGGHLGFKKEQIEDPEYALEKLVPAVVEAVKEFEDHYKREIPVIAAGGIYTGADAYDIMEKGAKGVQLGTRFVTTEECDANIQFKNAYINSQEQDMKIIQSPVGLPGRAISNSFLDKVSQGLKMPITCPFKCIKTCEVDKSPYCIITALYNAFKGKLAGGYAFAGSNAFRATKISTVKDLFTELVEEFKEKTKELSRLGK